MIINAINDCCYRLIFWVDFVKALVNQFLVPDNDYNLFVSIL